MPGDSLLQTTAELDELIERSHQGPVILFKHSLTCPISRAAYDRYQEWKGRRGEDDEVVYGLVEIQNAREISTEIARRTGVRHESPQVLLVRHGEVSWHASHGSIQGAALEEALRA